MTELHPTHRRRHYGRRRGPKLRAHQAGLLTTLLPKLSFTPKAGVDPKIYFDAPVKDVWLEIGFGAGEHLVWQAENNPAVGLIGAEPYISGIAKLLSKIAAPSARIPRAPPPEGEDKKPQSSSPKGRGGVTNIRIYEGDARDVVAALPDACLGCVFILFPDPWPKTRHHKRRFIQMEMLDQLARVMKHNAELRFATDDNGYLVWTLERLMSHPKFIWAAWAPTDWRARPPDWPETRYEAKAIRIGKPCIYLRFRRA